MVVTRDVQEAIEAFGHSPAQISEIMDAGRAKAAMAATPVTGKLAAAIYAYTQDSPLYMTLTFTVRTPHTSLTPTDTELKKYADVIVHAELALSCLPAHVSELPRHGMVYRGMVYRGIRVLLNWRAPSLLLNPSLPRIYGISLRFPARRRFSLRQTRSSGWSPCYSK
jgi:hypothetical protein